jgi:acetolactate decarboxylase
MIIFLQIVGWVQSSEIHIVNLPVGSRFHSSAEARQEKTNNKITNENCEILGFFSTDHKSMFTHYDKNLHMHLITADIQKLGHLDSVDFIKEQNKLFCSLQNSGRFI